MKRKNSKAGIVFIIIGIILCLGAAALVIYNNMESDRAGKASEEVLAQLMDEILHPDDTGTADQYHRVDEPQDPKKEVPKMLTMMIGGNEYIGMVAIPSLDNLELPVMSEWNLEKLEISPCLYTGSYYTDDMVICGHNYTKHFGKLLNTLKPGADVYFITAGGEKIRYIVVNKETVDGSNIDFMIENCKNNKESENDWDLTLFTCNLGGQTRCAVRCKKAAMEVK